MCRVCWVLIITDDRDILHTGLYYLLKRSIIFTIYHPTVQDNIKQLVIRSGGGGGKPFLEPPDPGQHWTPSINKKQAIPVNTRCGPDIGLMLGQRRTMWTNIDPTLGEICPVNTTRYLLCDKLGRIFDWSR